MYVCDKETTLVRVQAQAQVFTQRARHGRINHVTVQIEKSSTTNYEEINKQEKQAHGDNKLE
jgi:hypothetical protein